MISLPQCLSLKLFFNSLVYDRNIFGSSSKVFSSLQKSSGIFGYLPKLSENVRHRLCDLRTSFRESSESGRKPSENRLKHRHQDHLLESLSTDLFEPWTLTGSQNISSSTCFLRAV